MKNAAGLTDVFWVSCLVILPVAGARQWRDFIYFIYVLAAIIKRNNGSKFSSRYHVVKTLILGGFLAFSYACADREEMKACSGIFVAETEDEVCRLIDFHAKPAHA